MTTVWKAELTEAMIAHLTDDGKRQIRRDLDDVIAQVCSEYEVGREYSYGLRTTT